MPGFGFTSGTGGAVTYASGQWGSRYQNNTGGDVYVDTIHLTVAVARTATFQCAIYLDDGGIPGDLIGVSDILSSIAVGTNDFPVSGDPLGVSDGQYVWIFVRNTATLSFTAIGGSNNVARSWPAGSSAFPSSFLLGWVNDVNSLPLTASGSATAPGTSNLDVSFFDQEVLTEGYSNAIASFVDNEVLSEGRPNVAGSFLVNEPLSEGYPNVSASLLLFETLHPVAPELSVSTDPFPGFGNSTADPSIPAGKDPAGTNLPGLAFSVHKKPFFATRVNGAASGYEVRNALMQYPRWDFELTYEFLEDRSGADSSLKHLMGFFLQRRGSYDSWLFKDPDDYLVVAGPLGTADGVTTEYAFLRTLGGFAEKVGQIDLDNNINIYFDGVPVDPADYTVTVPNLVVFDSAPAEDVEITADFQFFFACRFIEDQMDFEKFMDKLWALQTCEFRSIIQ